MKKHLIFLTLLAIITINTAKTAYRGEFKKYKIPRLVQQKKWDTIALKQHKEILSKLEKDKKNYRFFQSEYKAKKNRKLEREYAEKIKPITPQITEMKRVTRFYEKKIAYTNNLIIQKRKKLISDLEWAIKGAKGKAFYKEPFFKTMSEASRELRNAIPYVTEKKVKRHILSKIKEADSILSKQLLKKSTQKKPLKEKSKGLLEEAKRFAETTRRY